MALMVRVKLLTRMAGPAGNFPAGMEVMVAEDLAQSLVAGGFALRVDPPAPVVEEAVVQAPEKAVTRNRASRSRTKSTRRDNGKDQ